MNDDRSARIWRALLITAAVLIYGAALLILLLSLPVVSVP